MLITNNNQILYITKITNMKLIDKHKPGKPSPIRDVLFVTLASGEIRRLDMFAMQDTTDIEYWDYEKTWRSKEISIWKHLDIDDFE